MPGKVSMQLPLSVSEVGKGTQVTRTISLQLVDMAAVLAVWWDHRK